MMTTDFSDGDGSRIENEHFSERASFFWRIMCVKVTS